MAWVCAALFKLLLQKDVRRQPLEGRLLGRQHPQATIFRTRHLSRRARHKLLVRDVVVAVPAIVTLLVKSGALGARCL